MTVDSGVANVDARCHGNGIVPAVVSTVTGMCDFNLKISSSAGRKSDGGVMFQTCIRVKNNIIIIFGVCYLPVSNGCPVWGLSSVVSITRFLNILPVDVFSSLISQRISRVFQHDDPHDSM